MGIFGSFILSQDEGKLLNSSAKFDIYIEFVSGLLVYLERDIDVDDLKRRVLFPVRNVELKLETRLDEHAWEQSRFFDAFFLICHPSYIRCRYHVIRKTMEGNTTNQLKEVLLKNSHNGNWEALTTSKKSDIHTFTDDNVKAKIQDKEGIPSGPVIHLSREAARGWMVPLQKESTLHFVLCLCGGN
ncbi:hypothetical protein Tco_0006836 [Tanacetum coccineum]